MQLPQIRMTSQMGKIAIEQQKAVMEITQPKAAILMEQPKAEMTIRTTKGTLTIDQTQAWEETNLMNPIRFTEKFAAKGKQAGLKAVQRRAEQGAQLIDIHLEGNPFAEQAIQNGYRAYKEPSLTYIPSPLAVKTNYAKGQLKINVVNQKPSIDVQEQRPNIDFERGDVHISMEQYASLTIDFDHIYG